MLHMIIEQTYKYPMRMKYDPETRSFSPSESYSLCYVRNFIRPYGWIKESGTPPQPHWDCILMSDKEYELGDEAEIKLIGMFKRSDGDHKFIVVEAAREIDDFSELSDGEKEELSRLYHRVGDGEGWFGRQEAAYCMEHGEKPL